MKKSNKTSAPPVVNFSVDTHNPLRKKQALVAISLKLLRVVFTLGQEKRYYDPQRVLGDYRRAQLQQAA